MVFLRRQQSERTHAANPSVEFDVEILGEPSLGRGAQTNSSIIVPGLVGKPPLSGWKSEIHGNRLGNRHDGLPIDTEKL